MPSIEKYLNQIKPYLKAIINNLKKSQKIHLTIALNIISSKDNGEEVLMNTKSNKKEIMINDKADEVTKKLLKLIIKKYQNISEISMRGSDFIFDCIHLLYCKCHKINPNHGRSYKRSYKDSPVWIKNKKATINSIKKSNRCYQCTVTVVLNYEKTKIDPQRITKSKSVTNNWEGMNYPSKTMIRINLGKII